MTRRTLRAFSMGLVVLLGIPGCAGRDRPVKTVAIVTVNGKPFSGATVTFVPEDTAVGRVATGFSGSDGNTPLTTDNTGDGVVPGVYRVTVSKREAVKSTTTAPSSSDPMEAMKANYGAFVKESVKKGAVKPADKTSEIPARYGDPTKTPFKFTVPIPGGQADLTIQKE